MKIDMIDCLADDFHERSKVLKCKQYRKMTRLLAVLNTPQGHYLKRFMQDSIDI